MDNLDNREQIRSYFYQVYEKIKTNQLIHDPLEKQLATIIEMHPEYHQILQNHDYLDQDYLPEHGEINPFLHMGMHISIHEQVSINQPVGVKDSYQKLLAKYQDAHQVEHMMMDCLGEMLWISQQNHTEPNPMLYLKCLKKSI